MPDGPERRLGAFQPGVPAWNRRKPAKYEVHGCTKTCSLSEEKLGPDLFKTFHGWYEQALGDIEIGDRSDKVGHHVSYGAVSRHRANHLVVVDTLAGPSVDDPLVDRPDEKVSHIEVLEAIIAKGARTVASAKITPDVILKAMDMHYKMTQGKALDDTMAAIAAAMAGAGGDDDAPETNRAAIKTPAELAEEMAAVD